MVNEVAGYALACLVAADSYHHLDTKIRPKLTSGRTVICDRYLASTLLCDVIFTAMVALTTLTPDARDTFNGHLARVASRSLGTSSAAAS